MTCISGRTKDHHRFRFCVLLVLILLAFGPMTARAKSRTKVFRETVYLTRGYTRKLTVQGKAKKYKWKTKSKKTVSVTSSGRIKAKRVGTTTVTATGRKKKNRKKFVFTVVVEEPELSDPTLQLEEDQEKMLTVSTFQDVAWASSNPAVATVSGGTVRGRSAGTALITATVGGQKTLTCQVQVSRRDWTKDRNGDGLPDYWDDHAARKVQTIRSRAASAGGNGVQFQFITDFHFPSNRLLSMPLVQYVARNTGIRTVVNGGDLLDSKHTRDEAFAYLNQWNSYLAGLNLLNVRGNHDANAYPSGRDASYYITDQEYFSLMLAGRGLHTQAGKLYYYVDNVPAKTRFIVLDSGSPADSSTKYNLSQEQRKWLADLLYRVDGSGKVTPNIPQGWHVIIFQHAFYKYEKRNITTLGTYHFLENEIPILKVAKNAGVDIVAVFSGHIHRDYNASFEGIPVIATMCDAINKTGDLDPVNIGREWETPQEQAFDVVQVDYNARKIFMTRIGCGKDREFSF